MSSNSYSRKEQFDEIRRNLNDEEKNNIDNLIISLLSGRKTEQTEAVYKALRVTPNEASDTTRQCIEKCSISSSK
jgi:hypothetical protein